MTSKLALAAALVLAPAAGAAVVTVDEMSPGVGAVVVDGGDGLCSLREAIDNANDTTTGQPHTDCDPGDPAGADTLVLPAGAVFTLSDASVHDSDDGNTGLPYVTSEVTIAGGGATIERDAALACIRDSALTATEFRLLFVAAGASLTVEDAVLRNGCVDGNGGVGPMGGGIFADGSLTLRRTTMSTCRADLGGAVAISPLPTVLIEDSTFVGNLAGNGGGVFLQGALTIRNSTFSDNSANQGAAVYMVLSNLTLEHVTFSDNAAALGGGMFSSLGVVSAKNVVLRASTCFGPAAKAWNAEGANLDSGTSCANLFGPSFTGNATIDLGPLTDNGGPTPTRALLPGSDGIDAATDCTTYGGGSAIATDQRGVIRPQGTACDIGAYEVAPAEFGDAPAPYPTLLADDGARHALPPGPGLFLGSCADGEIDGQPTAAADGDDAAAGSPVIGTCGAGGDEDGVAFTSAVVAGALVTLDVTASAAGLLDAWVDWDADGDWADAGEQVFTNESLAAGVNALAFQVPAGATPGTTFARFRLSSAGGLAPTGFAAVGEVEDYPVTVEPSIQVSIGDVSRLEGDAGPTPFAFPVTVSSTAVAVSVTVQTSDGTATAGSGDYAPVAPLVITFPQGGATSQDFIVQVQGDTTPEADETFAVQLSSPSAGAVLAAATGVGTILDDDAFKADVVGTKTAGGELFAGGTVVYTVALTNLGPGTQLDNPGDEFVDVLPPELALVSASADFGTATADIAHNTVRWNGQIAAGATVTITVEATLSGPVALNQAIANQGTIHYDADGRTTNEAARSTDDPGTGAPDDPTVFLVRPRSVLEIPTLGSWGLGLLALALAAAGLALRRR